MLKFLQNHLSEHLSGSESFVCPETSVLGLGRESAGTDEGIRPLFEAYKTKLSHF